MDNATRGYIQNDVIDLSPGSTLRARADEVKARILTETRIDEPRLDAARQTKLESMVEVWINTAIGFAINFTANLLILPHFGFSNLTVGTNFVIGLLYTVISVARSYVIRRWAQDHLRAFNRAIAAHIRKITNG